MPGDLRQLKCTENYGSMVWQERTTAWRKIVFALLESMLEWHLQLSKEVQELGTLRRSHLLFVFPATWFLGHHREVLNLWVLG